MPQPTVTPGHIDSILTQMSVAYMQRTDSFIANKVFPVVNVQKQSDLYFTYNKNDWFRDEAAKRADATESVGSGYSLSTDGYKADVWAFHKDVGQQAKANFDSPLDAERDAASFVTQRLMLRQEIQWVTDYFVNGVWGTSVSPAADQQWDNYLTSDPVDALEDAMEAMLSTTGYKPNTMVVGYQVDRALRNHPDIIERNKYTSSASITSDMVARFLQVDRYLVASAIKATNAENVTPSYAFVHGKHALLCYSNPAPSLLSPSAGYTFQWQGVSNGLGTDIGISRIPMDMLGIGTVRVEGQIAYDNKMVAADMGYFFNNVVS